MQLLVVEDNEVMAEAIQRGLIAEGYGVDVANDGNDGIWRIREFDYAGIILDIMLPGMNGYEICRTIRSEGIDTPILMLTAKDGDYDIAEGLDFGANDYLTKPFSFVVLTARVRALVRRQTGGSSLITVGDLVLDTVAHSCHLGGAPIDLTQREYFLLEAFARHAGQPLTRGQLTIFVTAVFAGTLSLLSVLTLNVAEDELIANTRGKPEAVLANYLEANNGAVSSVAVVDPAQATRFFYLDSNGLEVPENEFFQAVFSLDGQLVEAIDASQGEVVVDGSAPSRFEADSEGENEPQLITIEQSPVDQIFHLDTESGEFLDAEGQVVMIDTGPVPDGSPYPVVMGEGVIAVAQTLQFADGTVASIGVSSPLQPVTDSLNTMRGLVWLAVPFLSALTAVITWLAATRALKPVTELTLRAQAIGATNIGDRLPVPSAQDEIHDLANTMNDMLSRLDRSQQQQRQFISDASHELRSPVAASRVQLEVAQGNPDETDWIRTADVVLAEQQRLTALIDDLLALSRLDEAGMGEASDVDLDDLVATESNRPRQVNIDVSIPQPIRTTGNLQLLTSAVRNLLDNACRHARTRVEVTLSSINDEVVLNIDHDGTGIAPEDRQAVFERFTRLDEARDRPSGGSGLGLAITREVARAHGGDVKVSTSPLGGARFTLTLPLAS